LKNLDEIVKVEHVDAFFIAPGDLAQSMGYPGQMDHPDVQAAVQDAVRRVRAAGRAPGVLATNGASARPLHGPGGAVHLRFSGQACSSLVPATSWRNSSERRGSAATLTRRARAGGPGPCVRRGRASTEVFVKPTKTARTRFALDTGVSSTGSLCRFAPPFGRVGFRGAVSWQSSWRVLFSQKEVISCPEGRLSRRTFSATCKQAAAAGAALPESLLGVVRPAAGAAAPLGAQFIWQAGRTRDHPDVRKIPQEVRRSSHAGRVGQGWEIAAVEKRLPDPEDLMVVKPLKETGKYGGRWRRGFTGPADNENGNRIVSTDKMLMWDYTGTR